MLRDEGGRIRSLSLDEFTRLLEELPQHLAEMTRFSVTTGLRQANVTRLQWRQISLERRHLWVGGHVSNGDKKRLHAIRFLGNDAVHEIKEPKASDLRIALEIVEHLLNTVYILDRKAKNLETVAETYDEFLLLLKACAVKYTGDNAVNLLGILGGQRRLVGQSLDAFETQLKSGIGSGVIDFLSVGQLQTVGGKEVQLYEIVRPDGEEPDDIPF